MGQLVLLQVGVDPHARRHQREQGLGGIHVVADLQLLHLGGDPVLRGGDDAVGAVQPVPGHHGVRRTDGGMPIGPGIGHPAKLGEGGGFSLLRRGQLLLGGVHGVLGQVHLGLGGDAGRQQGLLPGQFPLLVGERVRRRRRLGLPLAIGGAIGVDLQAGLGGHGLALGQGGVQGLGIEAEQHVAGMHQLVLVHRHLDHPAGNVAGHLHPGRLDIGVVRGLVAPAGQPDEQGPGDHHHRHPHHQRQAQAFRQRTRRQDLVPVDTPLDAGHAGGLGRPGLGTVRTHGFILISGRSRTGTAGPRLVPPGSRRSVART